MGRLGLGAMIHMLGGGTPHEASEYIGRKIVSAVMDAEANRFVIGFEDGIKIAVWDAGQSCCESRYMRTDDDPASLVGHVLTRIDAKDGPNEPDEWGEHEVCFVEIGTDQGFITIANHNEHNGYYGGFGLSIDEVQP